MREINRLDNINRRACLKGLAVGGFSIAGIDGFTMTSAAQNGEIPALFCGEASLPPQNPPGGQAGQCIGCVEEICDGPTALEPLFSGLSGTCFTLPAEDIPEGADYLTLKAGQNCFLAEVPADPSGDVTFCLQQVDGQPPMLQDISNATFYACKGENPPTATVVKVTCEKIIIETTNIPDGSTLQVTVTYGDGTTQTEDVTVMNNQATVILNPGNLNPINVRITYQPDPNDPPLVLFDAGVTASDAPCGDDPAVDKVDVRCDCITIQTANIPTGSTLNVTVIFDDDSEEMYTPEVDADGVAEVDLPGDRNPSRLIVTFDGNTIFDSFVEAADGPCPKPVCPPGLNIAYTRKYGEWWPDTYDDIGEEVDPDVFSIEGNKKKVTICAPFPFAVSYATRKMRYDGRNGWGDDKKHHDKKHRDKKRGKHHGDPRSCDCFKDCKKQEPVLAEPVDGQFCATISSASDGKRKKKSKICWFRVHCPEKNGDNHDGGHDDSNHDGGHDDSNHDGGHDDRKERDSRHC